MPDLGPSPAPGPPPGAAQLEKLRVADADANWALVTAKYPAAIRPDASFTAFLPTDEQQQAMIGCLRDGGVPVDAPSGGAYMIEIPDQKTALTNYACQVVYPIKPISPPSPAQLGYIYDHLTRFIVPCDQAHGYTSPQAPSRDYFIAHWPHQDWFPSPDTWDSGAPDGDAISKACPPTK